MFIIYLDVTQGTFIEQLADCIKNKQPFFIGRGNLEKNSHLPLRLRDFSGRLNNGNEFHENVYWIGTSGTTGNPKYFGISFDSLYSTVEALDFELGISQNDTEVLYAPTNYSFGLARLASAIIGNRDYVITKNLTDLRWINKNHDKPISMGLNPYMLKVWFDSFEQYFRSTRFSSLKLESGSMPLSDALVQQTIDLINPKRWTHHYGMTEASRTAFKQIIPSQHDYQPTEIGIVRESIELNLDSEKPFIKGPNIAKFQLVDKRIKEIRKIELNDVFEIHNSAIHIVGRSDDFIKYKGSLLNRSVITASILDEFGIYSKLTTEKFELYVIIDTHYSDDLSLHHKIKKFIKNQFQIDLIIICKELAFTETGKLK